jgi:hypothetical protein
LKVKGELNDVTMREATIGADDKITFVPNGKCVHITTVGFDLLNTCGNGSECAANQTCNPATRRCDAGCVSQAGCVAGSLCVTQVANASVGACYATCTTTVGATCGGDFTCSALDLYGTGNCIAAGDIPEGQACTGQYDVATDCGPGLLCQNDSADQKTGVCRNTCNPLAATPGCPAGQVCSLGNTCLARKDLTDSATLGQPCSQGHANFGCASDGKSLRGYCYPALVGNSGGTCRQLVTAGTPCSLGTSFHAISPAQSTTAKDVGVCAP